LNAASLGETYLFLENMEVNTSTGMTVLITPSTDFDSGGTLTIYFPHTQGGEWCKVNDTTLSVTGVESSALDIGGWSIDGALTGSLTGKCFQGSGSSDTIVVSGVGELTAGSSYGVTIDAPSDNKFTTGSVTGSNVVTVSLQKGEKVESATFSVTLVTDGQIILTADVIDAESITCSISTNLVAFDKLFRGGAYATQNHTLSVTSSDPNGGFYWAVYGEGDGSGAGLATEEGAGYLLPSTGGTMDLRIAEGFGLISSAASGFIPENFTYTASGVFGSIGMGFNEAKLIFAEAGTVEDFITTITLGARASSNAVVGDYTETLTYICGSYIAGAVGGGTLYHVEEEWSCGDDFTDSRDDQIYPTVEIGTQCWLAENLHIGTMITNTNNQGTSCAEIEKYCLDDVLSNCDSLGGLYQWDQAMCGEMSEGVQGICPNGWKLPTESDFVTLLNIVGQDSSSKLRHSSWSSGEDLYGFGVIATGARQSIGGFSPMPGELPFGLQP
jgi:uncharacterized protein (TIGR02145 family)